MKFFKYFFEFIIIIFLFFIFKIIGLKYASSLGGILTKFFGPIFRSKEIIKENIKTGLGKLDANKEGEIINAMWSNIGRTFAEYIYLKYFKFNKSKINHMEVKGLQYLEEIKKNNKSVVFYSAPLANFELMAMELDRFGIKCAAIYRPLNNYFLNPIMEYLRKKYICPFQIPKGRKGMREIISKVKDGCSVALMVDQRVSEGPRIPFFNKPAHTTTIPAQLALKYDCKLVAISIERVKDTNFVMEVHKPYKFEKTGNDEIDTNNITIKINQEIEKMILNNPKQWFWTHNRWK